MNQLQDLGADALSNIVAFEAGAEIVALLETASLLPRSPPPQVMTPLASQKPPYLSLDGKEEADEEFDRIFDFLIPYGNAKGSAEGNVDAPTIATANMQSTPGLSAWTDSGFGFSGDASAVFRGGKRGTRVNTGSLWDAAGDDDRGDDRLEDDEAALALAADSLLGYDGYNISAGPGPDPPARLAPSASSPYATVTEPWFGAATTAAGSTAASTVYDGPFVDTATGEHRRPSTSRLHSFFRQGEKTHIPVVCEDVDVSPPPALLQAIDDCKTGSVASHGTIAGEVRTATGAPETWSVQCGGEGRTSLEPTTRNSDDESSGCGTTESDLNIQQEQQIALPSVFNFGFYDHGDNTSTPLVDLNKPAGRGGRNAALDHEVSSPGMGSGTDDSDDYAVGPIRSGEGGSIWEDGGVGGGGGGDVREQRISGGSKCDGCVDCGASFGALTEGQRKLEPPATMVPLQLSRASTTDLDEANHMLLPRMVESPVIFDSASRDEVLGVTGARGGRTLATEGGHGVTAGRFEIPVAVDGDVRVGGGSVCGGGVTVGGEGVSGGRDGVVAADAVPTIPSPKTNFSLGVVEAPSVGGFLRRWAQQEVSAVVTTISAIESNGVDVVIADCEQHNECSRRNSPIGGDTREETPRRGVED